MAKQDIFVVVVFNAQAINASGNVTSNAIDLSAFKPIGNFGIQLVTAGAASVVKLEGLLSNDNITYNVPSGSSDIVTAHAAGSAYYDYAPKLGRFLTIKATETAGHAVSSMTLKLAIQ